MQDPLKALPGYILRRASAVVTAELSLLLSQFELRIAELSVLFLIEANANITQSALCRALDIQRANMTPLAARLVERGLIARQQVDGRSQGLVMTEAGQGLVAKAHGVIAAFESGLIARVAEEHRPHVLPVLRALWHRV